MASTKTYTAMMHWLSTTVPKIVCFPNITVLKCITHSLFYIKVGFPLPFTPMYETKALRKSLPDFQNFIEQKRDYEKSLEYHKHDTYIQEPLWLNPLNLQEVN